MKKSEIILLAAICLALIGGLIYYWMPKGTLSKAWAFLPDNRVVSMQEEDYGMGGSSTATIRFSQSIVDKEKFLQDVERQLKSSLTKLYGDKEKVIHIQLEEDSPEIFFNVLVCDGCDHSYAFDLINENEAEIKEFCGCE